MADQGRLEFKKLGMIGAGSMGGMMSLLYAEHGVEVHFFDPDEENVHKLNNYAKGLKTDTKIVHQKDYKKLCDSIETPGSPKFFVFSIPHGTVGDKTVESLMPYLNKGDIILDCSNEHWQNTERRQKKLDPKGIRYVGCGVSGGYQAARHGPSMSPGGTKEALDAVMPFLRRVAAKDKHGRPCTTEIGPGGSGHYVKMVHNGIEQGMMSAVCEVWFVMNKCLNMEYEEIADVFEAWNKSGPLIDNFLVSIGVDVNRTKNEKGEYVLAQVRDKVVQDVDEEEGTGIWTCEEAVRLHVPAPTIVTAHLFRCASADAARRVAIQKAFGGGVKPSIIKLDQPHDKTAFVEDLKMALYASFLSAFSQGLLIIKKADREHKWNLNYTNIIRIWRGGCIIQSDHIADLIERVLDRADHDDDDFLSNREIGEELEKCFPSLKNVVLKCVEADAYIPSISATLEYYKYSGSTELPTQFMEAELDYFGGHMFDLNDADPGKPIKGTHHFEWKPAKGILGDNK